MHDARNGRAAEKSRIAMNFELLVASTETKVSMDATLTPASADAEISAFFESTEFVIGNLTPELSRAAARPRQGDNFTALCRGREAGSA